MAKLTLTVNDAQLEALRRFAVARHQSVAALLEAYVAYLLAGGQPVPVAEGEPALSELATLAQHGGGFEWLADEPDLYTEADGEPV
jgi:hypothetical protein